MRLLYKIIDWIKDMYLLFRSESRRLPKDTVGIVKRSLLLLLLLLLDIIGVRLVKVHNGYNDTHFICNKSMFFFKVGALVYNTRWLSPITFDGKTTTPLLLGIVKFIFKQSQLYIYLDITLYKEFSLSSLLLILKIIEGSLRSILDRYYTRLRYIFGFFNLKSLYIRVRYRLKFLCCNQYFTQIFKVFFRILSFISLYINLLLIYIIWIIRS